MKVVGELQGEEVVGNRRAKARKIASQTNSPWRTRKGEKKSSKQLKKKKQTG